MHKKERKSYKLVICSKEVITNTVHPSAGVTLKKGNGSVNITVYRKPTHRHLLTPTLQFPSFVSCKEKFGHMLV